MCEEKNNVNELLSKEDNSETPLNPSNADELRYVLYKSFYQVSKLTGRELQRVNLFSAVGKYS